MKKYSIKEQDDHSDLVPPPAPVKKRKPMNSLGMGEIPRPPPKSASPKPVAVSKQTPKKEVPVPPQSLSILNNSDKKVRRSDVIDFVDEGSPSENAV